MARPCIDGRLGFLGAVVFLLVLGFAPLARAAQNYDLYSWKKDTGVWCFSLLPATKATADAPTAQNAKDQQCGRHDVKRLMGSVLDEGAKVKWKVNESQGLILPPAEIVNDLRRFATTMDFEIVLQKGLAGKEDQWK